MPQSASFAVVAKFVPIQQLRLRIRCVRLSWIFCLAVVSTVLLSSSTAALSAYGQGMPAPTSTQTTTQSQAGVTSDESAATSADNAGRAQ